EGDPVGAPERGVDRRVVPHHRSRHRRQARGEVRSGHARWRHGRHGRLLVQVLPASLKEAPFGAPLSRPRSAASGYRPGVRRWMTGIGLAVVAAILSWATTSTSPEPPRAALATSARAKSLKVAVNVTITDRTGPTSVWAEGALDLVHQRMRMTESFQS